MIKHWEILLGVLALAAGAWGHIKAAVAWARGLVIVTAWLDYDATRIVAAYLTVHGRRVTNERAYEITNFYVRSIGAVRAVASEWLNKTAALFWLGRRPIWLKRPDKPLVENEFAFTVSGLRGTIDIPALLASAAAWAGDGDSWRGARFRVVYHHGKSLGRDEDGNVTAPTRATRDSLNASNGRRPIGFALEDLGGSDATGGLASMVLMPEVARAVDEVRNWFTDRGWYREHQIPWRLGLALEGPPGTGKTSLVRALGVELDLPVHVFDLATMSNEDLRAAWAEMTATAPCIALIEDIDAVFDGRTNITPPGGLMTNGGCTFDTLLNVTDGVERFDGVLLVITTNHLEKLDPALRDREGRVDRVVHFAPLDMERRLELAQRIIGDPALAYQIADCGAGMPASKFARQCCQAALAERRGETSHIRSAYR